MEKETPVEVYNYYDIGNNEFGGGIVEPPEGLTALLKQRPQLPFDRASTKRVPEDMLVYLHFWGVPYEDGVGSLILSPEQARARHAWWENVLELYKGVTDARGKLALILATQLPRSVKEFEGTYYVKPELHHTGTLQDRINRQLITGYPRDMFERRTPDDREYLETPAIGKAAMELRADGQVYPLAGVRYSGHHAFISQSEVYFPAIDELRQEENPVRKKVREALGI